MCFLFVHPTPAIATRPPRLARMAGVGRSGEAGGFVFFVVRSISGVFSTGVSQTTAFIINHEI